MRLWALRPADCVLRLPIACPEHADQTQHKSHCNFVKTGKPRSRTRNCEDHCTPGKVPNGVRWKNLLPLTESAACRKNFVLWSWRRDSNPRPSDYKSDALPTELRQQFPGPDAPPRKLIPLIPSKCPGQLFKVPQGKVSAQQTLEGAGSVGEDGCRPYGTRYLSVLPPTACAVGCILAPLRGCIWVTLLRVIPRIQFSHTPESVLLHSTSRTPHTSRGLTSSCSWPVSKMLSFHSSRIPCESDALFPSL